MGVGVTPTPQYIMILGIRPTVGIHRHFDLRWNPTYGLRPPVGVQPAIKIPAF